MKMISDGSAEIQEEMKINIKCKFMSKLNEYLLCITATIKSRPWCLKADRIKMHKN